MKRVFVVLTALTLSLGQFMCGAQETYVLDPTASRIQIHLETAGALGFMGHPHLIETPLQQGTFIFNPEDLSKSSVELAVDASALQVLDPKASVKDRKEIQTTMQSDRVLDIKRYPKIVFKSLSIDRQTDNRLRIIGNLTIRTQTHPVTVQASLERDGPRLKATGRSQFKQSTFGIQPVSAAAGTVRVQDEMSISFRVFGEPKPKDTP